MKKIILTLLCFLLATFTIAQHSLIPAPVSYESIKGSFVLDKTVSIDIKTDNEQVKNYFSVFQARLKNLKIELVAGSVNSKKARSIVLTLLDKRVDEIGEEGYMLEINTDNVIIKSNNPNGIFNGLQTLEQLIIDKYVKNKTATSWELSGCKIIDYPRFGWRGLMLDVSRHFFSVEDVKAYIDLMSLYKFNVFHWHLSDDEGWRIEIKSLPRLTEVGAWRVPRFGRFGEGRSYPKRGEPATYGGFYTQQQVKEIVQYATDRNITIVPEIDMPGHSMAILAAYPELSTKKEPKFVNPGAKFANWGDDKFEMLIENTLDPTNEEVYNFADKVFTEIANLFPGKYIHMGGDECYHGYWEKFPSVQSFMKEKNIKNTEELQNYFVTRMNGIINSKGKKMIGWDEILEGDLTDGVAIMSWRGMAGGINAAKKGHEVVMSPTTFCYLDYTQGDHSVENPIYSDLSLEKSYSFEPVPDGVNPKLILGGQGNLWTEVIPNLQFAFYMTYPRAFAISESLWSPNKLKEWNNFISRTESQMNFFDMENINISRAVFEPIVNVYKENGNLMCALKNSVPKTVIYYSIDNTYPVKFGKLYSGPFVIPEGGKLSLRTQTYRDNLPLGRELIIPRSDLEKRVKDKE